MVLRFCILTIFFCISFLSSVHAMYRPPTTPDTFPINPRLGVQMRPAEVAGNQNRIARPRTGAGGFGTMTTAQYFTNRAAQLALLLAPAPTPIQLPVQAAQNIPQPQAPAVNLPTQNVVLMNEGGIVRAYKEIEMTEDLRVRAEECLTQLRTEGSDLTCPVCLDTLTPMTAERDYTFTECGHLYCKTCFDRSINMDSRCPLCRRLVEQDPVAVVQ